MARPHTAEVQKSAPSQASADRETTRPSKTRRTGVAIAMVRQTSRLPRISQQGQAESDQAGPLASAVAQQQVVVEQTKMVLLEADRKEKQLQVDVRKPADAEAYAVKVRAEASRDAAVAQAQGEAQRVQLEAEAKAAATRVTGQADGDANKSRGIGEGEAIRAKGLAEADATKARAEALATNQEAVIGLRLAENWPAIVEQASKAFGNIKNMTVLDGAEGVTKTPGQIIGAGSFGLDSSATPSPRRRLDRCRAGIVPRWIVRIFRQKTAARMRQADDPAEAIDVLIGEQLTAIANARADLTGRASAEKRLEMLVAEFDQRRTKYDDAIRRPRPEDPRARTDAPEPRCERNAAEGRAHGAEVTKARRTRRYDRRHARPVRPFACGGRRPTRFATARASVQSQDR